MKVTNMKRSLTPTYSDEYLEHWGRIYTQCPEIFERGIFFTTFLVAPHDILAIVYRLPRFNGQYLPLLPRQRAIQQRQLQRDSTHLLAREFEDLPEVELHGDRLMQPIHHRAFPTKSKTGGHKKCA